MRDSKIAQTLSKIYARIYWKTRGLKRLRTALLIIGISAIVALCGLAALETVFAPKVVGDFSDIRISVPMNVSSSGYFMYNKTISPGYFWSSANAYVYVCSPYADVFNFTFEYSTDNSSWVKVPIVKSDTIPQDLDKHTIVGTFSIDKPTIVKLYGRYELPPQNVSLPTGVTPATLLKSLHGQIVLASPRNPMLELLVSITLFSLSLSIIRLLRDEWSKKKPD